VGSALGQVTLRLNSALSLLDDVELPPESVLNNDELACDDTTKCVDDKCRELRESIMLVIQSLYKVRNVNDGENQQVVHDEGNI